MITVVERDRFVLQTGLHKTPTLYELALARFWPDTDAGRENMARRLGQLCAEGLLARHSAVVAAPAAAALFYHWCLGMPDPDFGAFAWELSKLWEAVEPRRVVFYTVTERAARHYGRTIRNPLKSPTALAHDLTLSLVFADYALHRPLLASAWVAEEAVAATRGWGEKVVDACVVDSTRTPALAVEIAGASYAASNGARLKAIHRDCAARSLPYEMWTVSDGGNR